MRDRDRCSVTNPPECGDGPAPRITGRAAALGKAFAEGHVTEGEAEALAALIEARQVGSPKPADQGDVGKSDAALNRLASPRMDSTPLIHLRTRLLRICASRRAYSKTNCAAFRYTSQDGQERFAATD